MITWLSPRYPPPIQPRLIREGGLRGGVRTLCFDVKIVDEKGWMVGGGGQDSTGTSPGSANVIWLSFTGIVMDSLSGRNK